MGTHAGSSARGPSTAEARALSGPHGEGLNPYIGHGKIANNGILLKLNADDLENFEELSYTFDKDEVLLKVFYSYEYR